MTNPEMRCASTTLEVPNFQAEVEVSARQAGGCVAYTNRQNAALVLRHAADRLACGQFSSIEMALDFVLNEVL